MPNPIATAVLISGNGSNLQALLDATRTAPDHPARITLVISNRADVYGLERARIAGVPSCTIVHTDYPDRAAFDAALHEVLAEHRIGLVCLAGFMRLLTPGFTAKWEGRMLNIHPSLLPDYKGLHTHERVLADGRCESGCTVHYVTAELDAGPTVIQKKVAVLPDDTPDTLQRRIHAAEHEAYPEALLLVANRLRSGLPS